jgi:hypothetical protein
MSQNGKRARGRPKDEEFPLEWMEDKEKEREKEAAAEQERRETEDKPTNKTP